MKPDIHVDMAKSLERAGFDYILIEDTSMVEDSYNNSAETSLRRGFMAPPKNDPLPLVPLMTQATKHIGIVPTVSTIQYPPFLAARAFTTLDHLTEGRVGMNVVTSVTDRVAQNFGYERHLEHDERYEMAMEWIDVVKALQNSWEEGAVIADPYAGVYADHTKVNPIEFVGKFFKCRGPLNTIPGPQREVPICSAGSSEPGRVLAANYDDTQIAIVEDAADAKAYREDIRARAAAAGRNPPDHIKVLFIATPTIAATDAEAQAAYEAAQAFRKTDKAIEYNLWNMSYTSGVASTSVPSIPTPRSATSTFPSRTASTPRSPDCSVAARTRRFVRSSRAASRSRTWVSSVHRPPSPTRWARSWRRRVVTASCSTCPPRA